MHRYVSSVLLQAIDSGFYTEARSNKELHKADFFMYFMITKKSVLVFVCMDLTMLLAKIKSISISDA